MIPVHQTSFFLSPANIVFLEENICQLIISGDGNALKDLIDGKDLSVNYVLKNEIRCGPYIFEKGSCLLYVILKCCIDSVNHWKFLSLLELLVERNADIVNSPAGGFASVLEYLAENNELFSAEIIIILLKSVSSQQRDFVLSRIENVSKREYIKKQLLVSGLSGISLSSYSSSEFEAATALLTLFSNLGREGVQSLSLMAPPPVLPFYPIPLNDKESPPISSDDPSVSSGLIGATSLDKESLLADVFFVQTGKLCLKMTKFENLEAILQKPDLLEKCNNKVEEYYPGESFFSFLIRNFKDSYLRHRTTFIFLKYGYTPEDIVSQGMSLLEFLCHLKVRSSDEQIQYILIKTLTAVFFLCNDDELIASGINLIGNHFDKKHLAKGFVYNKKVSKKHFDPVVFIRRGDYRDHYPVLKGFLEASLLINKNAVTGEPWSTKYVFVFLIEVLKKLFEWKDASSPGNEKRREILMELLQSSLSSINTTGVFTEEEKSLCKCWLKGIDFYFFNTEVEKLVLGLLKTYWGDFLKNDLDFNWIFSKLETLLSSQPQIITNKDCEDLLASLRRNDFTLLEQILEKKCVLKDYKSKVLCKGGTLFYFVMSRIEDVFTRHRLCYEFLKYGHNADTIVRPDTTMLELLIILRNRMKSPRNIPIEKRRILIETLFLVFFFCNDSALEANINKLKHTQDREQLEENFKCYATGIYSKSQFSCIYLLKMNKYQQHIPIVRSFVKACLLVNKNVLTGEDWSGIFLLEIISILKRKLIFPVSDATRQTILSLLDFLLAASIHANSLTPLSRSKYKEWFNNEVFIFENSQVENSVRDLFEKYWGDILDRNNDNRISLRTVATEVKLKKRLLAGSAYKRKPKDDDQQDPKSKKTKKS